MSTARRLARKAKKRLERVGPSPIQKLFIEWFVNQQMEKFIASHAMDRALYGSPEDEVQWK